MRIIDQLFIDYRNNVMPRNAHSVQITECRRAFYTGALAMKTILETGPDDDAGQKELIAQLTTELEQFYNDVMRGKK